MTNTSSNLPVCIYCGTPRPADETLCPKCGNPWIDVSVSDATDPAATGAGVASAAAAAAVGDGVPTDPPPPVGIDDTGEFDFDSWTLPPEPRPSRARWFIPIVLLIGVVVLWAFVFVNRDGATPPTTVVALDTTTTTQQATTSTTQPSSTTAASTETTIATTTTLVYPPADSWDSIGDPIPIAELGLRASGIGPIAFGSPLVETAGALAASLGSAQLAGFDSDQCASQEWYWMTWGDLRAIFDGYADDAIFIGYRYENTEDQPSDPILETLSGVRLGDTVAVLQSTYGSYTVSFEIIDGKDHFRLLDGGELLLWGPVSSTDPDGTVEGIYSPDPCNETN